MLILLIIINALILFRPINYCLRSQLSMRLPSSSTSLKREQTPLYNQDRPTAIAACIYSSLTLYWHFRPWFGPTLEFNYIDALLLRVFFSKKIVQHDEFQSSNLPQYMTCIVKEFKLSWRSD